MNKYISLCLLSSFMILLPNNIAVAKSEFYLSHIRKEEAKLEKTNNNKIFNKIINRAIDKNLSSSNMGNIVQAIATEFLGSTYEAGLLDRFAEEKLFISLEKFDCLLFVETVLAISRSIALENYQYQTFTNNVASLRYKKGEINGYCSRLHYFSDWILDNENRNNVKNLTASLGGNIIENKLNFMSSNRQKYPHLINNNDNYLCIQQMESELAKSEMSFISKKKIRSIYSYLQPGDIIGIATNIRGLDVTHTGFVYKNPRGNIGFIHASPAGYVTIAKDLNNYVNRIHKSSGIIIIRPTDPR